MADHDPFDLSAQAEAKIEQDEASRLQRKIEVDDLKWLMGHKQGRRFVYALLQKYGVFRLSFRHDALEMAFLEGARNHGIGLIALIHEHCPERYVEMLKEQKESHAARRSSPNDDSSA